MNKLENNIKKILAKNLKIKKITSNISIDNSENWDSINFIKILSDIEKKFRIKINDKDAMNFQSYKNILKILKTKYLNEK